MGSFGELTGFVGYIVFMACLLGLVYVGLLVWQVAGLFHQAEKFSIDWLIIGFIELTAATLVFFDFWGKSHVPRSVVGLDSGMIVFFLLPFLILALLQIGLITAMKLKGASADRIHPLRILVFGAGLSFLLIFNLWRPS